MSIFDKEHRIGAFAGFSEGGLEFHADVIVPYDAEFGRRPVHGHFVLIKLEDENEALLGRITTVEARGRLTDPVGEDYVVRAVVEERAIPDNIRDRYLKYRIDLRILGLVRVRKNGKPVFIASHRRVPHVGAEVASLSEDMLNFVADAEPVEGQVAAEIGFLSFGEFVYSGDDDRIDNDDERLRIMEPKVLARFPISSLSSRRAVVFARAGFGKSNLMKLLLSTLYREQPMEEMADGKKVPVGTLVFDPEGEYFWPDNKGRRALADVPKLQERLVVFTDRRARTDTYGSFVAGAPRLDVRKLHAARLTRVFFSAERREQQNIQMINRLHSEHWSTLVDLAFANDQDAMITLLNKQIKSNSSGKEAQVGAAVQNIIRIVRAIHDPDSNLLDDLEAALRDGCLCVVDTSLMRGQGTNLAAIILDHFFNHNIKQLTESDAIPIIAVLEEAQTLLSSARFGESNPFVEWAKEGRKYGLGSILVTQQPGAIPDDLLSQSDSFFVFHLLSENDLKRLKGANAPFSNDLLASLLNEPIPGSGIVWSSVNDKPYPLPIRVLDFQAAFPDRASDTHAGQAVDSYASRLRQRRQETMAKALAIAGIDEAEVGNLDEAVTAATVHRVRQRHQAALASTDGVLWGSAQVTIKDALLELGVATSGDQAFDKALGMVVPAIEEIAGGVEGEAFERVKVRKNGKMKTAFKLTGSAAAAANGGTA